MILACGIHTAVLAPPSFWKISRVPSIGQLLLTDTDPNNEFTGSTAGLSISVLNSNLLVRGCESQFAATDQSPAVVPEPWTPSLGGDITGGLAGILLHHAVDPWSRVICMTRLLGASQCSSVPRHWSITCLWFKVIFNGHLLMRASDRGPSTERRSCCGSIPFTNTPNLMRGLWTGICTYLSRHTTGWF